MRNSLLGALGLALALAVSSAAVAQPSPRPGTDSHERHDQGMRGSDNHDRNGPATRGPAVHKDRYGSWNNSWGPRPGAAPKSWTRKGDWYRHVRACQNKYRSYNARTDTYRLRSGKAVRCKL